MDQVLNPYSPGAGARPFELAGRSSEVDDMDVALRRILVGRAAKSQLVTGLRGVGKTVLLHEFGRVAGKRGFIHEHIEVHEGDQLPLQLAVTARKALLKLGGKKKVKGVNRRALGVLKAFTLAYPVTASLQSDVDVVPGVADSGISEMTSPGCSRRWVRRPGPMTPEFSSRSTRCTSLLPLASKPSCSACIGPMRWACRSH